MFSWVVQRINAAIKGDSGGGRQTVLGILDIYGFEIMQTNSFEQVRAIRWESRHTLFLAVLPVAASAGGSGLAVTKASVVAAVDTLQLCINYCNEKLQQLFIQLTLKAEQEEYKKEGIKWEPVDFFDNKLICDMVEAKNTGIVAVLDNECLRPGEVTDMTFLSQLDDALKSHAHYKSWGSADRTTRRRNSFKTDAARFQFRIKHYAGEIIGYSLHGLRVLSVLSFDVRIRDERFAFTDQLTKG